jgi:hypothetical protein
MTMLRFALVAAFAAGLASCTLRFTAPPTGIRASGEPLSVRDVTTQHTSMEKREVGEVHYEDNAGRSYGSAKVYQDVPVTHYQTHWYLFQGDDRVDDVDFYAIAADAKAEEEARSYRQSGLVMNWVGLGTAGLGLLSTLAVAKLTDNAPASYVCLSGMIVGGVLWFIGQRRLAPENHVYDSVTAINTANAYNRRLAMSR